MAYSFVAYTGNGSTTQFSVPFGYIRREHVYVNVNQVSQSYTWVNANTVQLATAPAAGANVEVRRSTPAATPLVDFVDGSTPVAADFDTSNLQHLYLEQELLDNQQQTVSTDPATGLPTLSGQRLTNVGNPVNAQDAATKSYVDTGIGLVSGYAANALASANAAATSATNSANSASASATSATNSASSSSSSAASASLANDWATKTTSPVAGGEYSAKYNAQQAASSASAAASSASTANTHKVAAQAAQTAAEAARDQTLAAYDSFDDRYLGAKTSNPTVDNDGNPLVAGALYFNSVANEMRLYTGAAWVAAYVSGTANGVGFTPAGDIASTNVQAAIQELDTEKLSKAGGTLTGNVDNTATGYFDLPAGTTAQRPVSPNSGYIRFNTDLGRYEGYDGTSWSSIGAGATGGGSDLVFQENDSVVTQNYAITAGRNAVSAGPVTINAGATVTIPTNSVWVIV